MAIRPEKSNFKKNMDTSDGIQLNSVTDNVFQRVSSKESALNMVFNVSNLTAPHTKNLHIRGYVDFYGGYAEHTRNVLFGLEKTGRYSLKLTPIKTPIDIDPITWNDLNKFIHPSYFNLDKSDFICIGCPGWFREEFLPKDRKTIAWTMIETYTLKEDLVKLMNNADVLWNPTTVDYKRMKRSGVECEMDVVNLGYDNEKYNTAVKPLDIAQLRGRYVFGVLGSWNKRKGVKEIITAYCKTFKKTDPVSLFLVCKYGTRPYDGGEGRLKEDIDKWTIKWEFNRYLEELGINEHEAPHIAILDAPIHEVIMPNVLARFDCLVGFSRGESTWLPGLQAMAMGIPIIQMRNPCCGYMDYLHDVAFMCDENRLVMADEELSLGTSELYEGCELGEGNVEELGKNMKMLYDCGDIAKSNHRVLYGLSKSSEWTWNKTVEQINERLL